MAEISSWLSAARLRTLPLALSSILVGSSLAYYNNSFSVRIFLLSCLTTVFLQVLSNFANDLGDYNNGADLTGRVGPKRAMQSGDISMPAMKKAISILIFLSLLSGVFLLYIAFKEVSIRYFLGFLALGVLAIVAAYFYTAGNNPYGYKGYGDVSVFVFFGLVGVLGCHFLYSMQFDLLALLPAIAVGAFSVGVLNLNNIRDIESDQKANKITIPVKIGKKAAISYHFCLLAVAWFSIIAYSYFNTTINYWHFLTIPLFAFNGYKLTKISNPDPLLKQLALSTLLFSLLFGASIIF